MNYSIDNTLSLSHRTLHTSIILHIVHNARWYGMTDEWLGVCVYEWMKKELTKLNEGHDDDVHEEERGDEMNEWNEVGREWTVAVWCWKWFYFAMNEWSWGERRYRKNVDDNDDDDYNGNEWIVSSTKQDRLFPYETRVYCRVSSKRKGFCCLCFMRYG